MSGRLGERADLIEFEEIWRFDELERKIEQECGREAKEVRRYIGMLPSGEPEQQI